MDNFFLFNRDEAKTGGHLFKASARVEINERNNWLKKCYNEMVPKHLIVNKIETNNTKSTAEKFSKSFANIELNLDNKLLNKTKLLNRIFQQ